MACRALNGGALLAQATRGLLVQDLTHSVSKQGRRKKFFPAGTPICSWRNSCPLDNFGTLIPWQGPDQGRAHLWSRFQNGESKLTVKVSPIHDFII
ncbi:hypothetical protein BDZ94DRAFT_1269302 [Collybia nuda]|uniref:Uncharacterized protein n=1 Tax=Collybia nuda TaxID=64659 RepID=A0A9P5XYB2_9AGAR|nr:hypothetical protein BDZ94DRAFT_1269302 [Collybia nuda]